MSEALKTLLRSLSIIGVDSERVNVLQEELTPEEGNDLEYLVEISTAPGSTITIRITDTYWRYLGLPCYFVNFAHVNGNFMACQGTPHIEQAMFDLGSCFHMIPAIQAE